MRVVKCVHLVLSILLLCFSCAKDTRNKENRQVAQKEVAVAVAANVQFAMEEIIAAFEAAFDIKVKTVIGSSGKLTAQIKQGAPFDVLISANMKYPNTLFQDGQASKPPKIYALGSLVLWTMYEELNLQDPIALLQQTQLKKIGIANPKTAPYGEQAINVFTHYGIQEAIKSKLVYGESIAQTNQYVITKNCEVGLTAKSVVLAPNVKGKGQWQDIPQEAYEAIQQGVIITKYGEQNNKETATRFYQFLFSEKAQHIFKKYGYKIPASLN